MNQPSQLQQGAQLRPIEHGPLGVDDFARYAAASGDRNPLHTDAEVARAAGFADVIGHGMLAMGLMGRVAAAVAGAGAVRTFHTRFVAPTLPGETLRCGGAVRAVEAGDAGRVATIELWARNQEGALKATGSATILLSEGARP
jgi:acyl dehydratase